MKGKKNKREDDTMTGAHFCSILTLLSQFQPPGYDMLSTTRFPNVEETMEVSRFIPPLSAELPRVKV